MGGFGGAAQGASAGFTVGGPWGAAIGGGLGLIGGLMQAGQQKKRMGEYNRAEAGVQPVDPNQVAFLNRLKQQERFYRAGTDAASAFARQDQGNALAQTQANITRMGGGINQLLRSQQQANYGNAAIGAQASNRADGMLAAQGNLTNMIAERKYKYDQLRRDEAKVYMDQGRQDLMNLFAGGIASIPQMAGGFKRGPGQQPSGAAMTNQINASLPAGRAMSAATPNTPGLGVGALAPNQFNFTPQQPAAPAWWGGQQAPAWWR